MPKKILLLDDDKELISALSSLFTGHEIDVTENLIDFDYCIYEYPGIDTYDYVIMDLCLTGFTKEELIENIEGLSLNPIKNHDLHNNLFGWNYYWEIIRIREKTKNEKQYKKFILISGFADMMIKKGIYDKSKHANVKLIDKAINASKEIVKIIS